MSSSYHAYPGYANKGLPILAVIISFIQSGMIWVATLALLTGCSLQTAAETPLVPTASLPASIATADASTPPAGPTPSPAPIDRAWTDVSDSMDGICFEAAYDAAGRVFVLRNPAELANFYDMADNSELCREPVERGDVSFDGGAVVVGVWSYSMGCDAAHAIVDFQRDVDAREIVVRARLTTTGECPYELLRPLWLRVPDAVDYDVTIDITE